MVMTLTSNMYIYIPNHYCNFFCASQTLHYLKPNDEHYITRNTCVRSFTTCACVCFNLYQQCEKMCTCLLSVMSRAGVMHCVTSIITSVIIRNTLVTLIIPKMLSIHRAKHFCSHENKHSVLAYHKRLIFKLNICQYKKRLLFSFFFNSLNVAKINN